MTYIYFRREDIFVTNLLNAGRPLSSNVDPWEMKCRSGWINAGSFAGIVGLGPALVAANVGRKWVVNAGFAIYKRGSLQLWRTE